jgi:hypothetical protein
MAGHPTRSLAVAATLLLFSFLNQAQGAVVGWGGRWKKKVGTLAGDL